MNVHEGFITVGQGVQMTMTFTIKRKRPEAKLKLRSSPARIPCRSCLCISVPSGKFDTD